VDDEIVFISAATAEFPHRICFKFLQAISQEYQSNGDLNTAQGQRQLQLFLQDKMVRQPTAFLDAVSWSVSLMKGGGH
jgi:hypothetical protein